MGTDSITSGIERALGEKFGFARAFGGGFENFDEGAADDLPLCVRGR